MPKTEPFFAGCSSANCEMVQNQVLGSYDRKAHKKKPLRYVKGGLAMRLLEPAEARIIGGPTGAKYTVSQHGLAIEFRRCYEWNYIDRYTHKQTTDTCTEKKIVNIPQRTMNCYRDVSALLYQMGKGKKGRPSITHKVLAMVACSKSGVAPTRVSEPMTPAIVAAAVGETQFAVRKNMEALVKSGKLATDTKLEVLNEKQVRLPPKYQRAFDDFVRMEKRERVREGVRLLFGRGFSPSKLSELPEAETFAAGVRGFAPRKLTEEQRREFMEEAEEWKGRTGIVPATRPHRAKWRRQRKEIEDRPDLEQTLALGGHI